MFYSKTTGGFYVREIHGDNIPTDVVEITSEQHQALLEGQSQGKIISADKNGKPVLQDPPPDATYKLVNGKWEQCPDKAAAAKKAEMDMAVAAGMAAANQHIAVLQDAVDLEMATAEEEAALKSWRRYRVLLSRLKADAKYPDVKLPQRPDGGTA